LAAATAFPPALAAGPAGPRRPAPSIHRSTATVLTTSVERVSAAAGRGPTGRHRRARSKPVSFLHGGRRRRVWRSDRFRAAAWGARLNRRAYRPSGTIGAIESRSPIPERPSYVGTHRVQGRSALRQRPQTATVSTSPSGRRQDPGRSGARALGKPALVPVRISRAPRPKKSRIAYVAGARQASSGPNPERRPLPYEGPAARPGSRSLRSSDPATGRE